jgi:ADP-ribose pyrophosphatase
MDEHQGTGWRVLSSSYPIATPFLRLRSDVIELPDGTIIENYYVRETLGFTIIFALTSDQQVILVRQYKHGAARTVLELPAGAIDEGETAAECAARELAEETGYVGDEPELLRIYLADPTNSNGSFHLYVVRNANRSIAPKTSRSRSCRWPNSGRCCATAGSIPARTLRVSTPHSIISRCCEEIEA